MGRTLKGLIAVGLVYFLLAGTAMAEKVLRIPNLEDPKTADCQTTFEFYMLPLNIFDRLVEAVTVGPGKSELVPGLAEKWEISADGKIYTFHLRKGVLFHNGEELTAADVVYTFDRMLNPATKALNTAILDFVDGATERLNGKADAVKGLQAIDRYTVRITLREAYAPFVAVMASPQASIFNRKFTTAAGGQFGLTPETTCGTGPFILKTYVLNDRQELVANDKYFRGRPKLDRIVVRVVADPETLRLLFETDELDVFDCDYAIAQISYFYQSEKWKDHIISGPRVGIYYFSMNQRLKPFDDLRVRKAFQMAIDRELILEKQFYGKGKIENAVIPRGLACFSPDGPTIKYNPEAAKALLAEAGYPNGVDITIAQVSSWSAKWQDINLIVQSMVKKAGFNVTIKQMDEAAYYATRKTGDVESYAQNWAADFNDPDNFLYTFFSERGTLVRSLNNHDPAVFKGIDDARTMTDPTQRCALYRQLENRIVYEDVAWVPLFSLDHTYVVQPRVKHFVVPWNGWSDMNYFLTEVE
ncbi:Glutathione-binding protein gsiB [Desulfosarcina cetonica]|uniref:ABC transporter substrate-binding protein n=1 Tax=Desulfosarcina cetonica TaxID=90730 RepID=UPI0006D02519|nr:ABC transporter substrate-binding protein [Desulfosarcina cetonica]VTR68121.1 Glutathione-binding protein gsiB [Desulfosarcina cetonica]